MDGNTIIQQAILLEMKILEEKLVNAFDQKSADELKALDSELAHFSGPEMWGCSEQDDQK